MSEKPKASRRPHVPTALYWKARLFGSTQRLWHRLAAIESRVLRDEIDAGAIDRPIYIAGVPRAGTTVITEMLARHPDVASHRYSDFPNVYTPYWRNWLAERSFKPASEPIERAHRDRVMVTPESPEAVEEVIWMQFFEHLHDPAARQILDDGTSNPAFERFYRDHVRKLLLVRDRARYLTKGNYNVTRLGYLLKLFPDARFVVPVRHPVNQVASLVKQDRLFTQAAREDARVVEQLHMSGHFEFGPEKRCVHVGDQQRAQTIRECWRNGRDVAGWAHYWASVYGSVLDATEHNEGLAPAVHFVAYEALCRDSERVITDLVEHCRLAHEPFSGVKTEYSDRLEEPDYYRPDFSESEIDELREITRSVAERFGYRA